MINFELNTDEMMESLYPDMLKTVEKDFQHRIKHMRCSEHHQSVTIKVERTSNMNKPNISIDGCCDKFNREVLTELEKE